MTALDIEIAVMAHFKPRVNVVVPNVSWGAGVHECDVLSLTPSGYATEIEIKISKADLIKDKEKCHRHLSSKIKWLWFAIPEKLLKFKEHIPKDAGIIVVKEDVKERIGVRRGYTYFTGEKIRAWHCKVERDPIQRGHHKWTEAERHNLTRLGALRILGLKKKIQKLKEKNKN